MQTGQENTTPQLKKKKKTTCLTEVGQQHSPAQITGQRFNLIAQKPLTFLTHASKFAQINSIVLLPNDRYIRHSSAHLLISLSKIQQEHKEKCCMPIFSVLQHLFLYFSILIKNQTKSYLQIFKTFCPLLIVKPIACICFGHKAQISHSETEKEISLSL